MFRLTTCLIFFIVNTCYFSNSFVFKPFRTYIHFAQNQNNADMNWDPNSAPKLNFDEDLYTVLEVPPNCTPQELKKKYLKLVFQYHPDNKESEEAKALANRQMMVINSAYKILKDAEKRADYDRKKRLKEINNRTRSYKTDTSTSTSTSSSPKTSATYDATKISSSSQPKSNKYNFEYPPWAKAGVGGYDGRDDGIDDNYAEDGDSMVDVLSDIFSEFRKDGGKSILKDITDFLEDQIPEQSRRERSTQSVEVEVDVKRAAVARVLGHIKDLRTEKTALEASALWHQMRQSPQVKDSRGVVVEEAAKELESYLQCVEALKGVNARILEAEKQSRRLEAEIRNAETELSRRRQQGNAEDRYSPKPNPPGSYSKSKYSSDSYSTRYSSQERNDSRNTGSNFDPSRPSPSSSSSSSSSSRANPRSGVDGTDRTSGASGTKKVSTTTTTAATASKISNSDNADAVEEELRKLKKKLGML